MIPWNIAIRDMPHFALKMLASVMLGIIEAQSHYRDRSTQEVFEDVCRIGNLERLLTEKQNADQIQATMENSVSQ